MAKETFEKALADLEKAVENLGRSDLRLDETLRWFERGVERLAVCRQILQEAENRVEVLVNKGDGKEEMQVQPFHLEENEE